MSKTSNPINKMQHTEKKVFELKSKFDGDSDCDSEVDETYISLKTFEPDPYDSDYDGAIFDDETSTEENIKLKKIN
ncbi:MAG: hypothetical protein CMF62_02895 [Magnetococcales bacterium]|nr:hypothetical protein [Magnetococcales bacterium]|tara:strand:- start:8199 stop:8426 length:228 start_codon:yes stop_codon:yes gene_type:complete